VFVPIVAEDQAGAEAAYIVRLVCALAALAATDGRTLDLGIITPFRVQNNRIRDLLPAELRESITVDTVERFQGSERDIIMYGTTVANAQELESIESPFDIHGRRIDRKLNVAVTRARQQLVVVGNDNVVLASAAYRNVLARLERVVDLRHGRTQ
jgi:DNA replication ATP-dependent helicase Dna2